MINGGQRVKGHAGERELCKTLSFLLNLQVPLERNVDQTRVGGADIINLRPFAIEVKKQEALHIPAWIEQAKSQVTERNPIPALFYRQSRRQWVVMLPMSVIAKKKFRVKSDPWISMGMDEFIGIAKVLI